MRHSSHLLSPARALHRILLLELSNASKTATATSSSYSSIRIPQLISSQSRRIIPSPTTTTTSSAQCHPRRAYSSAPAAKKSAQALHDHDIPYQWVRIRDAEGKLSAPQRTESVLITLPAKHSLVMLAHPPPQDPNSATVQISAAICRIVDYTSIKTTEKAEKQQQQQVAAQQTKQLEFSWSIAPNDLTHKIKRLQEFLEKGMRVEVLLARKKGGRVAAPDEAAALVERVREIAAAVPGTAEYKRADGSPGSRITLFFEGPAANRKTKKVKKPEYYESKIPSDYKPRVSGQPRRGGQPRGSGPPKASSPPKAFTLRKVPPKS
jgi:translation initiation factor IF-3